jgi:hypothetical protein
MRTSDSTPSAAKTAALIMNQMLASRCRIRHSAEFPIAKMVSPLGRPRMTLVRRNLSLLHSLTEASFAKKALTNE